MLITDVRAHHISIPYSRGGEFPARRFRNCGAGYHTGRGFDRGAYHRLGRCLRLVCPWNNPLCGQRNDCATGPRSAVPDAAGIPAFIEQIQRNLHLFGRYGVTVCDIGARHRAVGSRRARRGRAVAQSDRRNEAHTDSGLCQPAADRHAGTGGWRMRGRSAAGLHRDQAARDHRAPSLCRAESDRRWRPVDGRFELPDGRTHRDRIRAFLRDASPMFLEEPVWPPEDFATLAEVRTKGGLNTRRARTPARCINSAR